uniref:Uncharacterized protein n=1 Tax=Setaria italica TaxID=4555 RepID=K3ZPK1_SETIT
MSGHSKIYSVGHLGLHAPSQEISTGNKVYLVNNIVFLGI